MQFHRLKIDDDLVNDLVRCTKKTFESYFNLNVNPVESPAQALKPADWLIIAISMRQRAPTLATTPDAILMASFSHEGLATLANGIRGKSDSKPNVTRTDVAGELINCIYGTVKSDLNARGYCFEMDLPVILADRTSDPKQFTQKSGAIELGFQSQLGLFYLTINPATVTTPA